MLETVISTFFLNSKYPFGQFCGFKGRFHAILFLVYLLLVSIDDYLFVLSKR